MGGFARVIAVAALVLCAHDASLAQRMRATGPTSFYVAVDGRDAGNDCLIQSKPCATAHYAYQRVMADCDFAGQARFRPFIHLAPGVYAPGQAAVNMTGQPLGAHTVNVVGAQSDDQSCTLAQAQQVVVQSPPNGAAFIGQDLAIPVIRCLTVTGTSGFNCRQTPASDLAYV